MTFVESSRSLFLHLAVFLAALPRENSIVHSVANLPRSPGQLICFSCEDCFVPRNLIQCSYDGDKCYFEHIIEDSGQEKVKRSCEHVSIVEDECDDALLVGKKAFACMCSFDACNSQNVCGILVGPTENTRYYQVPKSLKAIDFPGWDGGMELSNIKQISGASSSSVAVADCAVAFVVAAYLVAFFVVGVTGFAAAAYYVVVLLQNFEYFLSLSLTLFFLTKCLAGNANNEINDSGSFSNLENFIMIFIAVFYAVECSFWSGCLTIQEGEGVEIFLKVCDSGKGSGGSKKTFQKVTSSSMNSP
ncbi:hypothetical protein HELRODRAFT_159933 [Helobdella robusta]|uniref:Protein quiver n=1 Tax=Helobdella robusta TaxID=6412 RepID=T1EPK6_HELRO|nr:hypothetical protein HELRODRAFT_159933 [Helobdella robusta]ESO05855.1 hypothetical protein HELRODRAFT_159933 [Helobdella robusta]